MNIVRLAALSVIFVGVLGGCRSPGDGGNDGVTTSTTSALTAAQCNYFQVGGKTRICHATGSARNPYVLLSVSDQACVAAHSAHGRDYVSVADPTCDGQGCLPSGAPCDPTLPCCNGLACRNGSCAPVDLCQNVTCAASDQCHVSSCDPATGRCLDDPKVDGFPCDDGRTCISSDTCQTGVCRGNAGACGQTTNVTVGGSLQEVLLSRDGTRLYAANYATDAIDVVDVASAAWIDTIPTLPGPTSFAISRDGSTLFVSYTYQKHTTEVTRVDVATHAQTGHLPMATSWGTDPLAISGDGSRLYAGLYPYGPITEIQSSPFSATGRSYAANVYDAALTVSPDATMLWVGNIETGNTGMRIINLATSGSTGVSLPGGNAVTVFAPDGTSAYVRSHSGNGAAPGGTPGLYISDVSPSGIVLSSTSVAPIGSGGKMAVSPNGQRLVLTTQNSILIVDALTKTVLEVISASSPYGVAASNSQAFIGDVDHIVIVPLP